MGNVRVNPEIIRWAIIQSDVPKDTLVAKYPKIDEWLDGEKQPTFSQLKYFSNLVKVPFGLLFLKTPPNIDEINVEFRTINQKLNSNLSKDLRDTILAMDRRKSWMSEYRKKNNYDLIKWNISINYGDSAIEVGSKLRNFFGLNLDWMSCIKTKYEQFKFIRELIESKGTLVMMNGIVGNNTQRVLDIEEFRAFALNDLYAPLIFINRNDTESGMIFSIVHEFIHLIIDREKDDILFDEDEVVNERIINSFAAEFLVPTTLLIESFYAKEEVYLEVERLSNIFNVSTSVIALKLYKLSLIDVSVQNEILNQANFYYKRSKENRQKREKGGNFYSNTASRISRDFYNTVIHQAESGNIQFNEAYRLLNLKGNTYDKFKSYVKSKLYD